MDAPPVARHASPTGGTHDGRSDSSISRGGAQRAAPRRRREGARAARSYVDDLPLPGAWHGVVVRSPVSCGRLRGLTFDPAFDWNAASAWSRRPTSRARTSSTSSGRDMPFLAHDRIQYRGEPLALVAAPTTRLARRGGGRARPRRDRAAPARGPDPRRRGRSGTAPAPPGLHPLAAQTIVKGDADARARRARPASWRAATRPATRSSSTSSPRACCRHPRTRRRGLPAGQPAVPVLHQPRAGPHPEAAAGEDPRAAGRRRRRLRRQGGVPHPARRLLRPARAQVPASP
jgi:hypothetical protein